MGHALFFEVAIGTKMFEILVSVLIGMWGMFTYVLRHQESIEMVKMILRSLPF